jgi:DNA-binding CsgD family transcriptional regulator
MPRRADSTYDAVMRLSEAAGGGSDQYLAAIELVLAELFPCDLLLFNEIDLEGGRVRLTGSAYVPPADFQQRLLAVADEHPIMVHYLTPPSDPSPVRMSDLVARRSFERTRTYAEVFRPLGARYQMAILTGRGGLEDGRAWAFNRSAGDFTEDEIESARRLRAPLVLLDEMFRAPPSVVGGDVLTSDQPVAGVARPAGPTAVLTPREREVLDLLSRGWTAVHIAHALRLSPGTVRKHLQHVYDKLDTHDRLQAVDRGRSLGIIPPQSRQAQSR